MAVIDVNSIVDLDQNKLIKLTESAVTALKQTADLLLGEVKNAEVFPFDTGNLQNESTFIDDASADQGRVSIISDTPYARRLYYHPEYNFNREHNIAAGGKWYEPWLPGGTKEDDALRIFTKLYKKENNL